MASGRIYSGTVATGNQAVYQVPTGKVASFTISLVNRTQEGISVSIWLASATTPTDGELIEFNRLVPPNCGCGYERTGLVLDASKYVVINPSRNGITAVLIGFEETL